MPAEVSPNPKYFHSVFLIGLQMTSEECFMFPSFSLGFFTGELRVIVLSDLKDNMSIFRKDFLFQE